METWGIYGVFVEYGEIFSTFIEGDFESIEKAESRCDEIERFCCNNMFDSYEVRSMEDV